MDLGSNMSKESGGKLYGCFCLVFELSSVTDCVDERLFVNEFFLRTSAEIHSSDFVEAGAEILRREKNIRTNRMKKEFALRTLVEIPSQQ